jgi:cag pathogenicity island protein 24
VKYHRLTHEQFEELNHEFAVFLATQGLDSSKWQSVKEKEPSRVDLLLDLFSDMVWDKIIDQCEFLEFSTPDQLFLFQIANEKASVLIVKHTDAQLDISSAEGFQWVLKNLDSDQLTLYQGEKSFPSSRSKFVYEYLKKGAVQSDGQRFKVLKTYFSNSVK